MSKRVVLMGGRQCEKTEELKRLLEDKDFLIVDENGVKKSEIMAPTELGADFIKGLQGEEK